MTKWLITYTNAGVAWQLVTFAGPGGRESRGIVDLIAIRKNHLSGRTGLERGDLFEIVLIQIKGGSAAWPSPEDIARLRAVKRHHRAKHVVLAAWKKGKQPELYKLGRARSGRPRHASCWQPVSPDEVFA